MASTDDHCETLADALGHARHREAAEGGAMIRIDMNRPDTNHPDKRRQHHGRASCEVAGRRFETEGPAPIYKLVTLLWFHGHRGADFEVRDNLSPFGNPGGLAMTGRVRNWARLVKGKPSFDSQAEPVPDFTPDEVDMIARAAGRVSGTAVIDSRAPGNAHTGASRPSGGPTYLRGDDESSARVSTAQRPEAA